MPDCQISFVIYWIEQKCMTFDHDFFFSFSLSSSLSEGRERWEKNNQSRGQKSCLSARSMYWVWVSFEQWLLFFCTNLLGPLYVLPLIHAFPKFSILFQIQLMSSFILIIFCMLEIINKILTYKNILIKFILLS